MKNILTIPLLLLAIGGAGRLNQRQRNQSSPIFYYFISYRTNRLICNQVIGTPAPTCDSEIKYWINKTGVDTSGWVLLSIIPITKYQFNHILK